MKLYRISAVFWEYQVNGEGFSKKRKTPQDKAYAKGVSRFLGTDVSNSKPVQNYEKAIKA